jgi:uncharacterized delta-60 repeat protein
VVIALRNGAALALGIALLLWSCAATALAGPGEVDPRYGFGGILDITDALPGPEFQRGALATAVGPGGESFVLGQSATPCPPSGCNERGPCLSVGRCMDLHVIRVSAEGSIDTAFGTRASSLDTVELGTPGDETGPQGAIAVQPDGKVVVAAGDGLLVSVIRLNLDGSRDTSFGNPAESGRPAGEAAVLLGGSTTVTGLAVRPSGEILLTGAAGGSFFVSQLSADGRPDSGFGVRGTRFESFQPGGTPAGVALRGTTALVGGEACCVSGASMAVALFDSAGTRCGVLWVGLPKRLEAGRQKGIATVIPGPKGSTFVVGSATKGTFVAKYKASGKADPSFRDGGFALLRGLRSEPGSALRDSRGRIVIFGTRRDVPDTAGFRARFPSTTRLLPSGRYDPTYGGVRPLLVVEEEGQRVGLDIGRIIGLSQRSDGLLIMLGEAPANRYARVPKGPRFGLVRYLAGGRLP